MPWGLIATVLFKIFDLVLSRANKKDDKKTLRKANDLVRKHAKEEIEMASNAAQVVTDIVTVATAGTAVALGSGKARKLVIKALAGNTGVLYFGDSTVDSSNGFEMAQGDQLILDESHQTNLSKIPEFDLANHFVDAATNGDKLSIIYQRF